MPNTAVVASIDLELDDIIHVSTRGQKRIGQAARRTSPSASCSASAGATTPDPRPRERRGPNNTLVVKFKGVNIAPENVARGAGWAGGMGGQGGQGMMAVPGNNTGGFDPDGG